MVEIRKEQGIQIYQKFYKYQYKKSYSFKKNFFPASPPKILKVPTKMFLKKILIHKP